jgi:hypothetical protein
MFGHGWVVVLVDPLDDGPVVVEWVVVEWFVVAAFATAKPMPMLRPKAPPAKARVVSGLLSFILLVLSWCVPRDHPSTPTLEFAQTEVGDGRGIAPKPTSTRPSTRVIVSTEGEAALTLDEIHGNRTEMAPVEHTPSHGQTPATFAGPTSSVCASPGGRSVRKPSPNRPFSRAFSPLRASRLRPCGYRERLSRCEERLAQEATGCHKGFPVPAPA